jgi:hypothetical protein
MGTERRVLEVVVICSPLVDLALESASYALGSGSSETYQKSEMNVSVVMLAENVRVF